MGSRIIRMQTVLWFSWFFFNTPKLRCYGAPIEHVGLLLAFSTRPGLEVLSLLPTIMRAAIHSTCLSLVIGFPSLELAAGPARATLLRTPIDWTNVLATIFCERRQVDNSKLITCGWA